MQDKMSVPNDEEYFSPESLKRMSDRENELMAYREHIAMQERELNNFRVKLKNEQLAREKELQKELESREKFFADRERKLFDRQKEVEEQLIRRQEEADLLRFRLETEIFDKELRLKEEIKALELEKLRYNEESRRKVESKSKDYVSAALGALEDKESNFHFLSKVWSIVGAFSLIGGLLFFGYATITSFESMPLNVTWEFIAFSIFKGLIAIALFIGLSKYAFLFSNSYMREALKNGDRRHAINFGKFYLESYGAAAEWTQVKEAFEHWNITGTNAFTKAEENKLNISSMDKVVESIGRIEKFISLYKEKIDK